jgi:hypothetical protein
MKKTFLFLVIAVMPFLAAACENPEARQTAGQLTTASAEKQSMFRQDMRKLWTDHTVWTRAYIVAAVDDRPEAQTAANRLLLNQEHIGSAMAAYYGQEAGNRVTTLLKEHIGIAVDLVAAAKAGDQARFNAENAEWTANGQAIADYLASLNPNWPQQTLRDMMAKHLATTTEAVTVRLQKNYGADAAAYDAVYDHILMMADALSDGIIKQFPDKF